ncbi:CUE domain-containing protein 1-like [Pollicipes pollicipes]|uniref:CUE domain-containing protein 1-like n=1 Tax=Pollicipes pollicipes TaxID=41117 RepID=UPI001884AF02|nr:CUE domain-containing protein 1-like [Pollicipes pollicipes]
MLQNDEFMDELRRNRDFMDALDVDTPSFAAPHWQGYESLDETQHGSKDTNAIHKYPDDEAFKERLKHMGKASRRKFAQLARLFHFNRRGGARAMLGHGPVPGGDQLLLSDDPLTAGDLEPDEPGHRPPFEDRHTVETSPREGGGRRHHQLV